MSPLPKSARRWIEWRAETRKRKDGSTKLVKTPVSPISGNRVNTYAKHDYWRRDKLTPNAKPGFVLGLDGDSAIIGFDLDTCRSKAGKLTPWASEVLDALKTYAEVSPSGTGVKAYARVSAETYRKLRKILGGGMKRTWATAAGEHPPGVMLALGGYFAVTGEAWGKAGLSEIDAATVREIVAIGERIERKAKREAGVDESSGWNDDTGSGESWRLAVETARRRREGATFEDFAHAVEDHPEALRSCEDSPRGFDGQLERDWERACAKVDKEESGVLDKLPEDDESDRAEGEKPKRKFFTRADLEALPRPRDIVEGVLYEKCMSLWAGAAKSGKSYLLLSLAHAVACGEKWAGRDVDQGNVLVLFLEGTGMLYPRIRAWELKHDKESPLYFSTQPLKLLKGKRDMDEIVKFVSDNEIKLVVVDTLSRATPGANQSAFEDVSLAIAALDRIKDETRAHVAVVHHEGYSRKGPRGSSDLVAAPDLIVSIAHEKGTDVRTAKITDNRHGKEGECVGFKLEEQALDYKSARGKPVYSATVKLEGEWFEDMAKEDEKTLTDSERAALVVLGKRPQSDIVINGPLKASEARELLKAKGWRHKPDADAEALKKARQRVLESLEKKGAIEIDSNDELELVQ